ncbi:hypothetical protein Zmor_009669 [Zophobas morio]|uniref:Odorant receptor n=1 Tax=Zophobas morio TaxID=2755281 RepID=A0AA38MJ09_9CUCU|nr:hypothetical protein Zmor_009669 [Zophobas morio]
MKGFNWLEVIRANILVLQIGGPWPFSSKLSKVYSTFIIVFLMVMPAASQTVELLLFTKDIKIFLGSLCLVLQEYQLLTKVFCLTTNFHILEGVLQFLDDEILFQPKSQHQRIFVLEGLSLWKKNFVVLNALAFLTAFSWTMFPILDNLTAQHELIFRSWFPYDVEVSPFYEISYSYQFVHLWFGAFVTHNIDTLVTALMTYIGLQCDLLCDNLRNLGYTQNESILSTEFAVCVKQHKKILRFSTNCVDFFSLIVSIQVATISVCIGICLLQISIDPSFSIEFCHLLFYAITILLQMFQYCWFGNEVLLKSSEISTAAFEINFADASVDVKKNLIFFMARTQRPIKIPVFKLTHLSLEIFVKVLRTAWSYFTLLQQVSVTN